MNNDNKAEYKVVAYLGADLFQQLDHFVWRNSKDAKRNEMNRSVVIREALNKFLNEQGENS